MSRPQRCSKIDMTNHTLRETSEKGLGVFAARDIKQGERILHVDLHGFQTYTLAELEHAVEQNPELDGDHVNYVGRGRYVIDNTPASYMNHSCNPNCCFQMESIAVYDVLALRDIAKGEELSHDYTANAIDQFAGQGFWTLECRCGSKDCRGKVTGDFFEMPEDWQARYYPYLPPSIKRKYSGRFRHLKK